MNNIQWLSTAEPGSIWRITGRYRNNGGTFTDCLATVIDPSIHGTDEVLLAMLPPLSSVPHGLVNPDQIDSAVLIVQDPFVGGNRFSAEEVIQMANETSDSFGNLYRIDFINRIKHEAGIEEQGQ